MLTANGPTVRITLNGKLGVELHGVDEYAKFALVQLQEDGHPG